MRHIRDARKLKWRYESKEHAPQKRLPAIADWAIWKKVTRRAGQRWDGVVEKVWKDIAGNQEEMLSRREVWGVQDRSKQRMEIREKASTKK